MSKAKGLAKAEEREEVVQFRKDMKDGKIKSYDQFPEEFWGLGMLLGVSYLDEMEIIQKIMEFGKTGGFGRNTAKQVLDEAKNLMDNNREAEALIHAYWMGKIEGNYQRKLREIEINNLIKKN